jgi:hypothetical protein
MTVDVKCALNANHTASRTKLASHVQRTSDVPVNFSWKINEKVKQLNTKAWNLPGGTRQFHIYG